MTYDGYDDYYDSYYSNGWPLDDDISYIGEQEGETTRNEKAFIDTARVEKKRANPGPLLFQSIQNECFRSEKVQNEGLYIFCPFRNITLNYEIRRKEESLSLGSFSHWGTQRVNDTVQLTQVYKDGFYCRMGDEHQTIVTFGCQGDGEDYMEDFDFHVQDVEKGTYSEQGHSEGARVNGSLLRGEADYWHAEDEGCVYKLHFSLPFLCSELPHIGLSVLVDRPEQQGIKAAVDVSNTEGEGEEKESQSWQQR